MSLNDKIVLKREVSFDYYKSFFLSWTPLMCCFNTQLAYVNRDFGQKQQLKGYLGKLPPLMLVGRKPAHRRAWVLQQQSWNKTKINHSTFFGRVHFKKQLLTQYIKSPISPQALKALFTYAIFVSQEIWKWHIWKCNSWKCKNLKCKSKCLVLDIKQNQMSWPIFYTSPSSK